MTIHTHRFWLASTSDLDRAKEAATAAVREGGAVIDVPVVGGHTVSMLISQGLPVVFESEEIDIGDGDAGDAGFPFGDFTVDGLDYP